MARHGFRPNVSADFDSLFDALADPERLRLIHELKRWPAFADSLAKRLGWTRDAASKQLHLMKRARLVRSRRLARKVEFGLSREVLAPARDWLADLCGRSTPHLTAAEVVGAERQVALAAALRTAGRRNMLECMCRGGPVTQGFAAQECGLSQGLASRGLATLVEVGLVAVRSPGPPRRYAVAPNGLAAALRWLYDASAAAAQAEVDWWRREEALATRAQQRSARMKKSVRKASPAVGRNAFDAFFAALADADRLELVSSLCSGVVTGSALAGRLGWERSEVSKQLAQLRKGGLVESRRDGRWVRWTPQVERIKAVSAWGAELRSAVSAGDGMHKNRIPCLHALSTQGRRNLLTQVSKLGPARQSELARACGQSQALACRGLAKLVACGLVRVEREDRVAQYCADAANIESLWAWLTAAEARLAKGRKAAQSVVLPTPGAADVVETPAEAEVDAPYDEEQDDAGGAGPPAPPLANSAEATVDERSEFVEGCDEPTSGELQAAQSSH